MKVAEQIQHKIRSTLKLQHLELINESHMHAGPKTDSHFKLIVVSEEFNGLGKVKRHQLMYQLLSAELAGPVHALALHLYSPAEYMAVEVPASPPCSNNKSL